MKYTLAEKYGKTNTDPVLGDYEAALANDPAIDPSVELDLNACVCFDDAGNPLNQCNECPR